jgi:hypothetical protein
MKIGFSFSKCIRDIADGAVDIDDVLVIITGTNLDMLNETHWKSVWYGYGGGEPYDPSVGAGANYIGTGRQVWRGYSSNDEGRILDIALKLWHTGRIHQPRKFNARPPSYLHSEHWYEVVHTPENLEKYPALQESWNQFQTLSKLVA